MIAPTGGRLRADLDPAALALTYADHGAAAVSGLTNTDHFQGSIDHLEAVHGAVNPKGKPVLRKEFIFDPYQVWESRASGADAILLIVAILSPESLRDLMDLAQKTWMQCLVEVHDEVARKVITALNGTTIRGRAVRADFDRPKRGTGGARKGPPRR